MINEIMVIFKLGKKYDKGEMINMTRVWDKEKTESPTGIEPMTTRTPSGHSIHLACEPAHVGTQAHSA